jgi:hypothetical protein
MLIYNLIIVLILLNCNLIVGTNKKEDSQGRNALTLLALNQSNSQSSGTSVTPKNCTSKTNNIGTFTDCLDGTVSYEGAGFFAGEKLTYAKCPVGYTSDGTTCSGTIQTFQWCTDFPFVGQGQPNFSISCQTNNILTSGPLFDACDKYSLGTKKWRIPSPIELKKLIVCKDGKSPITSPPVAFQTCSQGNTTISPDPTASNNTHKDIFPKMNTNLVTNLAANANENFFVSFFNTQERPDGGKSSFWSVLCVSDN